MQVYVRDLPPEEPTGHDQLPLVSDNGAPVGDSVGAATLKDPPMDEMALETDNVTVKLSPSTSTDELLTEDVKVTVDCDSMVRETVAGTVAAL